MLIIIIKMEHDFCCLTAEGKAEKQMSKITECILSKTGLAQQPGDNRHVVYLTERL